MGTGCIEARRDPPALQLYDLEPAGEGPIPE